MRRSQCVILVNLHEELTKIKVYSLKQSAVIIEYLHYLRAFVTEMNVPDQQIRNLQKIFERMRKKMSFRLPARSSKAELFCSMY